MVNLLWAGIIVIAIVIAGINGKVNTITPIIFSSAENAVNISLSMISIMAFWLGIMKIIEKSGFIHLVIFFLKPLAYWLFPGIPRNHRAMNSMLMNMSANLLGMGNAATPFGIKAMEQMQQLNPDRDTATDNMCTFLAINTSSLTLIPTTVIAIRAATGAQNPTDIVGTTIIASLCSITVAILADRLFRYYFGKKNQRLSFNNKKISSKR
ncbi:MAG TPA: nucleoside recognition protein [Firmicutes bacterium]|jgi:spore maturation protein A|nr:nucleoside recognition protein [Bacillota bacterium]